MEGKQNWYVVDGYRPPEKPGEARYEGHEAIMILNCNEQDAHCFLDIYFSDREPILGIEYIAPAQRISAFRTNDKEVLQGVELDVNQQYSLRIRSDIGVIVQYGRCDVSQANLSYIGTLGYGE